MNTKNYLKFNLFALSAFVVLLAACKKDRVERVYEKQIVGTKGIYILNEGYMSANNSSITYYDLEKGTSVLDIYSDVNHTSLGETANDLKVYGTKMYCVITGIQGAAKSFVEVMDAATAKTIKKISFNNGTEGKMPRNINFYNGKAYVVSYDGTISRIDTAGLAIEASLQLKNGNDNVGGLEGSSIANGKLYVANSVHPSYPKSLKTKVTVIDLAAFAKTKDIEVGTNPTRVAAAGNGDVYVVTWNDWVTFNKPTLVRLSSVTDAVIQTETDVDLGAISIVGNQAWVARDVYASPSIKALNLSTGKIGDDLITDGTAIATPYGLTINSFDNSVVISDSGTSKAFVFSRDGKLKHSFSTGSSSQIAAFNYKYAFVSKN